MTTAIIIVILVVILSVGLFFVIKKFSHVDTTETEIYAEEGSISDFNSIHQKPKDTFVSDTGQDSKLEALKAHIAIMMSNIYKFIQNQTHKLTQLGENYRQNQLQKRKQREQEIQEAIKRDQEALELELTQKANTYEADTSDFESDNKKVLPEIHNNPKVEKLDTILNPETKATDFVAQLLSEVDAVTEQSSGEGDISDTYYYEYMEKRYIDRIVANSKDIEAYKKLGELYIDIRNYQDALESFHYVLKLKPNDTLASRRVKDLTNRLQKQI